MINIDDLINEKHVIFTFRPPNPNFDPWIRAQRRQETIECLTCASAGVPRVYPEERRAINTNKP